jgi:hypothetical protein
MDKKLQYFYRECYDDALPPIYHTAHYNILNLWFTILENHPIHRAFYPKLHLDIAFYLLTVLTAMCFLSAVIYDHFVFFFGNSFSCGDRTSIFDCSSSKDDITCFWDASKSLCTSKYSDVDADNIFWCALFLTLLSIPVIQILWFCNLYFIKLLAVPYDEIKKSKIVIVSDRSLSNPNSSSNRKISFEKNVFTSVIHQEYNLFHQRLQKYLLQHPTFSNVWSTILSKQPCPDVESGLEPFIEQRDDELTQQRQFSLHESEIKKMIALSIKTTQSEIKKQIALETRILRTPRNSSVMPQANSRNLNSMSDLRHHPGHQILDHFVSPSVTDPTTARILQSNRVFIERFKVSRQLYLFLRDCLPLDARYLLDFQIYTRSFFTSIFSDPDTEFHDLLHFEHRDWKLRVRVKFVLAFSYCAFVIFMLSYFFLFVSSCILQKRYSKLSAAIASLGLWIVFTGAVIQPLITIVAQYVIPKMISRDVHSARRNCLKTLKDHYFHQVVRDSYEREIRSLGYNFPPPSSHHQSSSSSAHRDRENESYGQLLLSSQRFSSEYSEAFESSLIEKYRPLSSLSYPLIQLYLPLPYTMDMMKLLLDAEQVEIGALSLESNSPSLAAYWRSQPPYLPSETPQEKVDDDDDITPTSPNIPITAAPSRSARFSHPENDISCRNLLQNQRNLKEKEITSSLESRRRLTKRCSLRFAISSLIRLYFVITKSLSPSSATFYSSIISFRAIEVSLQSLLLIFLIFLVQIHEVLYFLHPMLALAPLVLLGWVCVVYYFILHTAYQTTRERRSPCHCTDRQVLTDLTISVLLQCGCPDCQYCNSFGMEIECDYCQTRPVKPISFNRTILNQQLHTPSSPAQAQAPAPMISLTPKQLLSLESDVSSPSSSCSRIQIHSVSPRPRLSSEREEEDKQQEIRGSELLSSPQRSHNFPVPRDISRDSGLSSSPEKSRQSLSPRESRFSEEDSHSSLESSEEFDDSEIVIRVPGKNDLNLSLRNSANHEEHIQEWIQEHHSEWNESEIPMPPVPTRKQSLQDPVVFLSSTDSEQQQQQQQQQFSGAITPTMLNLFSGDGYDSDVMAARSASTSFDFPAAQQSLETQSPSGSHRTPSIDSYLKALELRESYHSDRMSQYQDMILQKTAAKLHLKNRRGAKSRGGEGGGGDSSGEGFESSSRDRGGSWGGVGDDEGRTTSRGGRTEQTLNTLKTRLIKSPMPLTPTSPADDVTAIGTPKERVSSPAIRGGGSRGGAVVDESKESLVKSRVVKTDFETHISSLNDSIEKEKYRSQELLARRLQQKKEKDLRMDHGSS